MAIHSLMENQEEDEFDLDDITSTIFILLVLFLVVSMIRKSSFSRKGNQRIKSKGFWMIFALTGFMFLYFKVGLFTKV